MLFIILISVLLVPIALWQYKSTNTKKYLKQFDGPTPVPFLGNFSYFRSVDIILDNFLKLHQQYGRILKVHLGTRVTLSITDLKFLEFLMPSTKILDKSYNYKFLHRWLGTGLLTSTGHKWKKHRRILTPAYHFKILEQFVEIFDNYGDILVHKLSKDVDKPSVDIYPYITLCSLDIICDTSMRTKVNAQKYPDSEYVRSVKEMCRIVIERSMNPFKRVDSIYEFTSDYKKELEAIKTLHDYTNGVIKSRSVELQKEIDETLKTDIVNDDEVYTKPKKTLLDILLLYNMEHKTLTNEDIREEIDTFMFEGHDTTSSGISFCLYSIANNPEVQIKIMEELEEVFGDNLKDNITYQNLQKLKYLENVIKESLRLYPPVPFAGRSITEETKYGDLVLPKDISLLVNIFALHRDPNLYPEPDKFNPDRFKPENVHNRHPYAYMPFSAGSRNCIGQKFAMLEIKVIVLKILDKYELLPSIPKHKPILVPETILISHNGIRLSLKERKRNF